MRALERRSGSPAERDVVAKYARLAPEYDTRWSFYVEATTRETLARLRLEPTERVLDVGCGTGALLERLAGSHPAGLLSGVDPVPEMLAVARGRVPAEVELREGVGGGASLLGGSIRRCGLLQHVSLHSAAGGGPSRDAAGAAAGRTAGRHGLV